MKFRRAKFIRVWTKVLKALDPSGPAVSAAILAALADFHTVEVKAVEAKVAELHGIIGRLRRKAFAIAFSIAVRGLDDQRLLDNTITEWAAYFYQREMKRVDKMLRIGLLLGKTAGTIADDIAGDPDPRSSQGVIEVTRHGVAHLGRQIVKENAPNIKRGSPVSPRVKHGIVMVNPHNNRGSPVSKNFKQGTIKAKPHARGSPLY